MRTLPQHLTSLAAGCLAGIVLVSPGSVRAADAAPEARQGLPLSSVLWTAVLFGLIKEENADDGFFDVSRSPEEKAAAIKHLAGEIRRSTAENPLMIFCGGGAQVPCSALELALAEGASPAALKAVTFDSHSVANERDRKKDHPEYGRNWSVLVGIEIQFYFLGKKP